MAETLRLELPPITSEIRLDPIRQFDQLDVELLISSYLHERGQAQRATTFDRKEERLGQAEASELALRLLGFSDSIDSGVWLADTQYEIRTLSDVQVRGLIVLCVREFDYYSWTKNARACGRFSSLHLVLLALGQDRALNDITEPPESSYWQRG